MYFLLYNPLSNNMKGEEALKAVEKQLNDEEKTVINVLDKEGYEPALKAQKPGDVLAIVGGDGTINRFINYIRNNNIDITNEIRYYPGGTGNDFKKDIDEDGKLEYIVLNEYIKDLPVVTINGQSFYFINGIGYGIDGYCCEEGDKIRAKKPNKKISYSGIAIKGMLGKFKFARAEVTVDGVKREYKRVMLCPTMLGKYFGGGMKIAPSQDRLNKEHKVTSEVIYGKARLTFLMRFKNITAGKHYGYKDMVDVREGHEVTVKFDRPCALQVDGETFLNITEYSVKYN